MPLHIGTAQMLSFQAGVSKGEEQVILEDGKVIHTSEEVFATDGHVGHVGSLLKDPETEQLSYLIQDQGHLWGKKEIAFPVSNIERFEENTVSTSRLTSKELRSVRKYRIGSIESSLDTSTSRHWRATFKRVRPC